MKKKQLSIVKIGGEILNKENSTDIFLKKFNALKGLKILVHGGGKQASTLANRMGIESKMINGRRITDSENLDIAIMVYGGLLNKKLVARLQATGCAAIGVSGADGNAVLANKRPPQPIDFGFAGDIEKVNSDFLKLLLEGGHTPVMCALSHDGKGQMLNTNADTIASETAIAMSSLYDTKLYYVFDKPGVLEDVDDESSVIRNMSEAIYQDLIASNQITDGMIPKLDNGYHALRHQVAQVYLGNVKMLTDAKIPSTRIRL
ncbi:MAG: acetylglutamate kinase [Bacteroidia bacterium]|nr:acetylglutamate kinase [Bacteroidia bacterium]